MWLKRFFSPLALWHSVIFNTHYGITCGYRGDTLVILSVPLLNQSAYFADPVGFATALQVSDTCGHPSITFLNVRKDFHVLKLPYEYVPEKFHCCRPCS